MIRKERALDPKYGTHVWIGSRIRVGSRRTMTPMWPHVRLSGDEHCNSVLALHLYPLVSIDIWWQRHQRTWRDDLCDNCIEELRELGYSEIAINAMNQQRIHQNAAEQARTKAALRDLLGE